MFNESMKTLLGFTNEAMEIENNNNFLEHSTRIHVTKGRRITNRYLDDFTKLDRMDL